MPRTADDVGWSVCPIIAAAGWREVPLKHFKIISIVGLLAASAGLVRAGEEVVDVIIIAGQSNAVGAGHVDYVQDQSEPFIEPNEDVRYCYWLNGVTWTSDWRFLEPRGGYTFGVEMMLGYTLDETAPARDLAIMKVAYDGTSLACDWNPNGCNHNGAEQLFAQLKTWMTSYRLKIEAEGKVCNFAGLAWVQGESDMRALWMSDMYNDIMRQFIDEIRTHADNHDMPIAIALVNPRAAGYDWVEPIHATMREIAAADLKVAAVTCKDLPLKTDHVHFTADSMVWLGGRLADALLALDIFRTGDPPPEPPPVDTCPGDLNEDGLVGATDILLIIENWGWCP